MKPTNAPFLRLPSRLETVCRIFLALASRIPSLHIYILFDNKVLQYTLYL